MKEQEKPYTIIEWAYPEIAEQEENANEFLRNMFECAKMRNPDESESKYRDRLIFLKMHYESLIPNLKLEL